MPHVLGILTDQVNEYLSHRYRLPNTKISKIGDRSENADCGRHRVAPRRPCIRDHCRVGDNREFVLIWSLDIPTRNDGLKPVHLNASKVAYQNEQRKI